MKAVQGTKLSPKLQAEVLACFVHRNTIEHPFPLSGGVAVSDVEWLATHAFYVKKDGTLSHKHGHCIPSFVAEKD